MLEACKGQPLERFIHVSSLGVYAARHHHGTDESEPPPQQHVDGYTQSKVEAEQLALRYERDFGVPVVVLRPGFIYGPRDRTVMPRLIDAIRTGQFRYLGGGARAMNTIYVGNLVQAIFLAIGHAGAVGQTYNLTDGETVSKQRFRGGRRWHGAAAAPEVGAALAGSLPGWHNGTATRRKGAQEAPRLTQARVKFLGLNLDFSIDKAKRELGYQPRTPFAEAIRETMAWYRRHP